LGRISEENVPPGLMTYKRYLVGRFPWRPALSLSLTIRDDRRYHWILLAPLMETGTILITKELWLNF